MLLAARDPPAVMLPTLVERPRSPRAFDGVLGPRCSAGGGTRGPKVPVDTGADLDERPASSNSGGAAAALPAPGMPVRDPWRESDWAEERLEVSVDGGAVLGCDQPLSSCRPPQLPQALLASVGKAPPATAPPGAAARALADGEAGPLISAGNA